MLEKYQPSNVMSFFEIISSIPHGSGNEKALSDYLCGFAKDRGLWVKQDEHFNLIIKKPASPGKEEAPSVILQAHIDMVCEKNQDVVHDFTKDPLKLYVDGDTVKALGTTLGADNGLAAAMLMALMDDNSIIHPPLEILLTTNEEVGLLGARDLDVSCLTGKRLINLDSDYEGLFCTGCAGGLKLHAFLPVERVAVKPEELEYYILKVSGLFGGHSGGDINKERANAIQTLGRALLRLSNDIELRPWDIIGGLMDNAIPREARAGIAIDKSQAVLIDEKVKKFEKMLKHEYRNSDPGISLSLSPASEKPEKLFSSRFTGKVLQAILFIPCGIQNMSTDVQDLVETSNNLGVIITETAERQVEPAGPWYTGEDGQAGMIQQEVVHLTNAIRSSIVSRKYKLRDQITFLTENLGGRVAYYGDYPAWEFNPDSPLREQLLKTYEEMFGKAPEIFATHGGLECGYFAEKIPGIDIVSFGSNISDLHSPQESFSISSLERTWKFFIRALGVL